MNPTTPMACQTCLSPLDLFGDPPRYVHPHGVNTDGHHIIPVPVEQLHTIAYRCDFCGDPYPTITLTGPEVAAIAIHNTGGLVQNFGQQWATCATCYQLIDDNKPAAVTHRATTTLGLRNDPDTRERLTALHSAFLNDRHPDQHLITTIAWPAATIKPTDLPKIRDRLARLYRGHLHLPPNLHPADTRTASADGLDRASLYWIDGEFTDLADHATVSLPAVTIADDLPPSSEGMLVWARPLGDRHTVAATWTRLPDGTWLITCYRAIGAGLDGPPLQRLRETVGWLVPTTITIVDNGGALPEHDPAAPLAATWLLIAQHIADTQPVPPDPATRRSYSRAGRTIPDVRVVRIRPHTTGASRVGPADGGRSYQRRFWVTGHWRNQAYGPQRTLRRPVYIHPFLKGPDDQPINATTTVRVLGTHPHQDQGTQS